MRMNPDPFRELAIEKNVLRLVRERMEAIRRFAITSASGMDQKGHGTRVLEEVAGDIANLLHQSGPGGAYRSLPLENS